MKQFQLKFIDVMVGVVLSLGFQWWPALNEPWQYLAFVFTYLSLIDYWIDYNPVAKKYALRLEIDVIIHTVIIFSMFLLIFATQKSLPYFLMSFMVYRIADILWLWRIKSEHKILHDDIKFMDTWLFYDAIEAIVAFGLYFLSSYYIFNPIIILIVFICIRAITRFMSSVKYKKVFYAV